MRSNNKDWFHYSYYWRCWSRVILRGGGEFDYEVSIPITPINDFDSEWEEVSKVMIGKRDVRFSIPDKKDIWTHELPDEVFQKIQSKVGTGTANVLIHADVLNIIDWRSYSAELDKTNKRTIPLELCIRDFDLPWWDITMTSNISANIKSSENHFTEKFGIEKREGVLIVGGLSHRADKTELLIYVEYVLSTSVVNVNFTVGCPEGDTIFRVSKSRNENWYNPACDALDSVPKMFELNKDTIKFAKEVLNDVRCSLLVLDKG